MDSYTELYHYGIKGQQWGVQHGPPYPIDKETHKTIVKRGTKIHRLTTRDESKAKGHAYVTYRKEDNARYEGFFAALLRTKKGPFGYNDPIWTMTYSAAEDLVSPSKKERVDTFIELLDKDPNFLESITKNKHKQNKMLENKDTYGFKKFAGSLGGNQYGQQQYFKALKKKGYNYVIDDDDAGRNGHEPAIILDRNKSLNYEGKEQLTNKRINETRRKYGNKI